MTQVTVSLPDDLALRARNAGLLSDDAIRQLLEDAMRQEAGERLRQTLARIDDLDAVRAARRAAHDADRR